MFEDIKEQFKETITYFYKIPNPQVDDLFNQWAKNKRNFIDKFGLIYETPHPITVEIDEETKKERYIKFIKNVDRGYNFYLTDGGYCLNEFLTFLRMFVTAEQFFNNKLDKAYTCVNGTIIPAGTKVIRAFKYFIEDKEQLKEIQDLASTVIQEAEMTGKLCLSVHPLDFLTVSLNAQGWRSCHGIGGEYFAGNLSYMCDKCTMVAYIKAGNNKVKIGPDSWWNSKKWRQLLYFSDTHNLVFFSRQYPYSIGDNIMDYIVEALNSKDKAHGKTWCSPKSTISSFMTQSGENFELTDAYIHLGSRILNLDDVVKSRTDDMFYNDVLFMHKNKIRYSYTQTKWCSVYDYSPTVQPGVDSIKCLRCGKDTIYYPYLIQCNDCEIEYGDSQNDDFGFCTECGAHHFADDLCYITNSDIALCESCYNRADLVECPECGDTVFREDAIDGTYCSSYCRDRALTQNIKNDVYIAKLPF